MRIAFGGIHTECSTYNHHIQTRGDFTIVEGAALAPALTLDVAPDMQMLPLFHARAVPGGPIDAATYDGFRADFLARLAAALPVDGVFLSMHGAMHVVGMQDAEGDWIAAVRDVIGPDVPLAVSYDLHGNVTQKIIDAIDIFAAYRTAPHIDTAETRNRALAMLATHLRGGPRPLVGWAPVPVLMPGERSSTEDEPARGLYALLPGEDARPGVLDANLMVGYVWADTPRGTAAAVVTGLDAEAVAASAARLAGAYWAAREDFAFGVTTEDLGTCLDLAETALTRGQGPVILADSGDNPTGGGVGDRGDVLAAMAGRGMAALFAGIADAPAALAAARAGEGARLDLELGGSLGSDCPRLAAEAEVAQVLGSEAEGNLEVLVRLGALRVILTQRRRPFHDLQDFRRFGIEPAAEPMIVVKSGYLSPDLAPLANPALMALTDGAVNQDIAALANDLRPRPCYPFQTGFDWSPAPRLSARAVTRETCK